jgi:hypothetical protein
VRNSGAQIKRRAGLKRWANAPDTNPLFSTGSFVGKHANFCATVRAWQINVKRVVCTGIAPVGLDENQRRQAVLLAIVP